MSGGSGASLGSRIAARAASALIDRDLRGAFRQVVWVGEGPKIPPARPVVAYANHHAYFDSFLVYHLTHRVLERPFVVWMEKWDEVPLFGPVGALPFPPEDGRRRARTVRETARRIDAAPTLLLLYPEGVMGPPDAGLAPFRADLPRLARVLPERSLWWPLAIRVTDWGHSRPVALLTAGEPHEAPDGAERQRLQAALDRLQAARPEHVASGEARVLLDGRQGPDERWQLGWLAPFFRRLTPGL
ncbi:MAG: 1-acyl-sn-glycerol-3-phosphate acyltransferase [Bacteroidota bacterium]